MDDVVKSYPSCQLQVVLDNLNIHKNEAAKQWLLRHARVHFHFTPTHASWMNRIECFFSLLTRQARTQSVPPIPRRSPGPKGRINCNESSKRRKSTRPLIPNSLKQRKAKKDHQKN
jgi:transposase